MFTASIVGLASMIARPNTHQIGEPTSVRGRFEFPQHDLIYAEDRLILFEPRLRSRSPDIHHDVSKGSGRKHRPAETPCPECRARNDRRTFCAAAVVGDSTAS